MTDRNQIAAEQATFRAFANSYLRELDAGVPVFHRVGDRNNDCIELSLSRRGALLRIEITSRSLCGMHLFGRIWTRQDAGAHWREIEPLLAIHLMVLGASDTPGATHGQVDVELLERILLSCQAMKRYLDAADSRTLPHLGFLAAEQSLCFGHPLHPTPKSLQGMTSWQQDVYAPELGGSFQLSWFAAAKDLVSTDSAGDSVLSIVDMLLGEDAASLTISDGEMLIPVHPLQAEALMLDPAIQTLIASGERLRHLGPAGPLFTATSSVRTVFSPGVAWMPKFSLPVRITNSKRVNRRHELEAGVVMAQLFERAGINDFDPRLGFLHDSAYVTVDLPGQAESGFEVIFRENPLGADDPVVTVSALTAEPRPGHRSLFETVIRRVAEDNGLPLWQACRLWFTRYLDCTLDPLVRLYDRFGVALEAHQQNSLIDLSRNGFPTRYLYRDSQGFYLSNAFKARWRDVVPDITQVQGLFFDDREIRERFAYYLIVNQIFSVIARAGHDGLVSESELLGMLHDRLRRLAADLSGVGGAFAQSLLERPNVTAKANLAIRLKDVDELAPGVPTLYTRFPNPLSRAGLFLASGTVHALAS